MTALCLFRYTEDAEQAMGSLVVMASGFGPEGTGPIPDTVKDPPSPLIRAHKIRGSESPVVGCQQFTTAVVSGKISFPFRNISNLCKWSMDGAAIYRCEAEIGLLLLREQVSKLRSNVPPLT